MIYEGKAIAQLFVAFCVIAVVLRALGVDLSIISDGVYYGGIRP